jgi:hypothetical protein
MRGKRDKEGRKERMREGGMERKLRDEREKKGSKEEK